MIFLNKKIALALVCMFCISFFLQYLRVEKIGLLDHSMWVNQVEYVQKSKSERFDFLAAYAHPGGTIIVSTILVKEIFKVSYNTALVVAVSLISSASIVMIAGICYLLRRQSLWWFIVFAILSSNYLFDMATPPSAVASILVVLLCVYTLFIYENKKYTRMYILFWSIISGLIISTRTDIGVVSFVTFISLIARDVGWRKFMYISALSFLVFFITDPFMWTMPIQHIKDLVHKVTFHYSELEISLPIYQVLAISSFAIISIIISTFVLFFKKDLLPIPSKFLAAILSMTIILYIVFLTATVQTARYFIPTILIWEVFLPLFVFSLTRHMRLNSSETSNKQQSTETVVNLLVILPILLFHSYFFILNLL